MRNFLDVAGFAAFCAATCVAASLAQTPSAVPVTVVGQVVDAGTGAPIEGAVVNLNAGAQPSVKRTAATGADGRFLFDSVLPGKYYVFASKPGFFMAGLHDELQHGASDELVVGWPGPPLLTMKLRPHGSIRGTVMDDAGKPVMGAKVTALARQRVWPSWGKRTMWMPVLNVKTPVTDADGHYAIDAMDPGDYLIEVDAASVAIAGSIPKTFAASYAPGARSISGAVTIALGVGEHRVADVRLESLPVFDVSGVVVVPAADPAGIVVQLFFADDAGEVQRPAVRQLMGRGLSFTFARLAPGEYVIEARANNRFAGQQRVTIDDRSLTDVQVVLMAPVQVSGRVIWEGADRPPEQSGLRRNVPMHFDFEPSPEEKAQIAKQMADRPVGLVGLVPVSPTRRRGDVVTVSAPVWAADSTFTMQLFPGRFLAEDARLNGWFLKSFRIDGREAIDEPVEIDSNSSGAVLTLTQAVGEVRGTIVTASQAPDHGSMAILFSTNARVWPGIFATRGPHILMEGGDGTDRFTFPDVLPGEYYLAAIDPMPWDRVDEDMLGQLAASAVRVRVLPGAPVVRTLTRLR